MDLESEIYIYIYTYSREEVESLPEHLLNVKISLIHQEYFIL